MYQRAIWWIKRDLRLRDNPALAWCIEHARVLALHGSRRRPTRR